MIGAPALSSKILPHLNSGFESSRRREREPGSFIKESSRNHPEADVAAPHPVLL
jgi:hypothetical protein